ncbi:hypothetical protein KA005_81340 [bacterium]|nr:hypothetical protein [bacterium]
MGWDHSACDPFPFFNSNAMDGDIIIQKMLNGVLINDFVASYLWALIGFLVVFGFGVKTNAKKSGWSWPAFWNGWKRLLSSLLLIAVGIVFWPQISQFFFNSETPVELNMWSSLGIGLGLDRLRSGIKSIFIKKQAP